MAGHYECIGVPGGADEVFAFLGTAVEQGESRDRGDGGREILWRDSSGASVAVDTTPDGEILCARPSFAGSSRLPVRVNGLAEDPDCRFCSRLLVEVVDEDGEMAYPLGVELECIDRVMAAPPVDGRHALRVTAFADSIRLWPDEAAYSEETPPGDGPVNEDQPLPLAPKSLIPVGLFVTPERRGLFRRRAEPTPTAHALMTGTVTACAERTNTTTGASFWWVELETFGGCYDVVISADEAEGLAAGAVAQVEGWLIGGLEEG